jgi:hypothetical protein
MRKRTPLRLAIDVELARLGWSFNELVRRVAEATSRSFTKQNFAQRVDRLPAPTSKTVTLVAMGFGIAVDEVKRMMHDEAEAALADGRPVTGAAVIKDDAAALVPAQTTKEKE